MKVSIGMLKGTVAAVALLMAVPCVAVDAEAAEELARQENCLKCHGVDKSKSGPSYKRIAARHKNDPDAEEKLMRHLKAGEMVTLRNGEEEQHRIIKTEDEKALRNLVQWILSL